MRIALVHDHLAQNGGAEKVLKAFHEIWPEAPIFVLIHHRGQIPEWNGHQIKESFLAKLPGSKTAFNWYLPLMPLATERHDLSNFDVVLSTSSIFAKGVITSPQALHISYCHTPPRFIWSDTHQYIADLNLNRLAKLFFLPRLIHRLRLWDQISAGRVDHFIANSQNVRRRIHKYYRRESDVIYPPVETSKFRPSQQLENYFVAGGRLVPYKKFDLLIKTFNRLRRPLKIFGVGPEYRRLRYLAKPNIEFLGYVNESEKAELLSHALAFIHPQTEDLGITALESMASGRPVIAYADGGALETVVPGENGVFLTAQNWENLLDTILHFDPTAWDSNKIRSHVSQFDVGQFKQNIKQYVAGRWEEHQKGWTQPPLIWSRQTIRQSN